MAELLITSSVLILAVLLVRALFGRQMGRRLQYALWGLVLLRLLLPFKLPESSVSVMNYLPEAPAAPAPITAEQANSVQTAPALLPVFENTEPIQTPAPGAAKAVRYALPLGWALGALVCGGWLAGVNLNFGRRLKKHRMLVEAPGCPLPVYLCSEGLAGPCLFGLLRPAIYLTEAAAQQENLDFVLRHEIVHWRHRDQLWGALRCVCLAAYWFDPLVWAAAVVSKKDCELACDEAVTSCLPERDRLAYGRVLVSLVPAKAPAGQRFVAATTMTGTAAQMKLRLAAIAKHRKPVLWALGAAVVIAAAAAACTFTGARGLVVSDPAQPPAYLRAGDVLQQRERADLDGDGYEEELVLAVSEASGRGTLYWARPAKKEPVTEVVHNSIGQIGSVLLWREGNAFFAGILDGASQTSDARVWKFEAGKAAQEQENGNELYYAQAGMPLSEAAVKAAQAAAAKWMQSLEVLGGELRFTIPASYPGPAGDWDIQAAGRQVVEGMGGVSVHYLEQENTDRSWQAGLSYSIPLDQVLACEEFTLQASLPGTPGAADYDAGIVLSIDRQSLLAGAENRMEGMSIEWSQAEGQTVGQCVNGSYSFLQEGERCGQQIRRDLNRDGAVETLVLTRNVGEETANGRLYYLPASGKETLLFEGDYTEEGLQLAERDGDLLFWLTETGGTAASAQPHLWLAVNQTGTGADVVSVPLPDGTLTYQSEGLFLLYHYGYDMLEMDGIMTGGSYKPYYFQWNRENGLAERVGLPITEEQLRGLETAPGNPELADLLEPVKEKGVLTDILYREGGVVNINYKVTEDDTIRYHNLNLQLQNGMFSLITGNQQPESSIALETSDFGGVYLPRISGESTNAVYPSLPA